MSIHPEKLGKYILQERLGRGGMAEVWKAFDESLQRPVAIKFMHPTLQDDDSFALRFVREAQAVAALHHPNIVQIYDFETSRPGADDGQAYMVMDYIEGETLADYLSAISRARKFPPAAEIVSLFFSISEALDYAHQHGLLHRDIKPANILLDKRHTRRNPMGEPILTDFGIAKIIGTMDGTLTSSVFGTPFYMSPEQASGKTVSTASDIYALGVILYEMCTGVRPFQGDSALSILQQHITRLPPPPQQLNPAISPAAAAVLLRVLAKDPAERFPSAIALTSALAEALGVVPVEKPQLLYALSGERDQPVSAEQLPDLPTSVLPGIQQTELKFARPHALGPGAPFVQQSRQAPAGVSLQASHVPEASPLAPPAPTSAPVRSPMSWRRRGSLLALVVCLGIALLSSGLATYLHLSAHSASASSGSPALVGNGFFTSSFVGSGADNVGLNDTFQVRLTNVSPPAPGKRYYAWLLPDQTNSEGSSRALGPLVVNGGIATLPTPYVDPQHANLIASFSRFLVTEEEADPAPFSPSLDKSVWRYYAALPQNPPSSDCQGVINQLSALCHLRHLLSGDPELAQVHLQGGLDYWFLHNMEEVQKWGQEVVDHANPEDVRHKLVDILYILDGNDCIGLDIQQHAAPDLENTPDDSSLTTVAAIPLLDCSLTPNLSGYLSHIHNHLNAIIQAPGVQRDQIALASHIGTELNTLNKWLLEMQGVARQLLAMDSTQLAQTNGLNLRSEIEAMGTMVLSGGVDPDSGLNEVGIVGISTQIQQLATLDIVKYTA